MTLSRVMDRSRPGFIRNSENLGRHWTCDWIKAGWNMNRLEKISDSN